ncbi:uncharacterized protein LOC130138718 [Syzygium oleosum]|uniref:uncharacterized protein LOC130138718 n=1 Tax=Syzygium oleosum TaxID=219896 RepID=UPI0024BBB8B3|nr:uncharacterized protein LOC130138718 [Syzygium oleosum]
MAEVIYFLNKDTLMVKPRKKSPLVYRMIVLAFSMFCGVYICSICLKQISRRAKPNLLNIQITEEPCELHGIKQSDKPSIHYPKPKTFSRAECADNPVRYFVIVSTQRSGSGWFETLLNSHANVSSNGEIFFVMDRRKNVSTILQTLDKVYNLRRGCAGELAGRLDDGWDSPYGAASGGEPSSRAREGERQSRAELPSDAVARRRREKDGGVGGWWSGVGRRRSSGDCGGGEELRWTGVGGGESD